jgi:hypothetical protein
MEESIPEKTRPAEEKKATKNLSVSKTKRIPLMDDDRYKIFKEKWSVRPVVPGRYFDFESLDRAKINLLRFTDALGWTKALQIREKYFPKLVQAFFFQAKVFPGKSLIVSKIKDVEIYLTPENLGKLLSLPTDGICLYGDDWNDKLGIDMEFIYNNLFEPNTTEFIQSNLQYYPKLLNIMC